MSFQLALHNVLSDPNFEPPEGLLDLNLKGDLEDLLVSCSKKVCVKFSVNEAKLVLPIWEVKFPDDDRPRKTLLMIEEWLRDPRISIDTARAAYAGDVARNAAGVVTLAATYYVALAANATVLAAANTATYNANASATTGAGAYVYYVAHYVKKADPSITCEDQLRRLFKIMSEK